MHIDLLEIGPRSKNILLNLTKQSSDFAVLTELIDEKMKSSKTLRHDVAEMLAAHLSRDLILSDVDMEHDIEENE